MALTTDFLATVALAASRHPGPRVIPWPTRDKLGGFVAFENYAEWQTVLLGFRLPFGVPLNMADGFDRALQLYLLAWIDLDLTTAGDLTALTTLELVMRDCYGGKERDRRRALVAAKAEKEKRAVSAKERLWAERQTGLSELLKFMIKHDALSDDKLGLIRRCGGSVTELLTGKRNPSLAAMRNTRAHGSPFGSGFTAGLLELIRDLIEYAYLDRIAEARA